MYHHTRRHESDAHLADLGTRKRRWHSGGHRPELRSGLTVDPFRLIKVGFLDPHAAFVAVLDVDADPWPVFSSGFHQNLHAVFGLALQLQPLECSHEVIGERRAVGGILPNRLPAYRWGPGRRNEEVLLELWWAEKIRICQLLEWGGVSPVDTEYGRGATEKLWVMRHLVMGGKRRT